MHTLGKKQGALLHRYVLFLQSLKCIQSILLLKDIHFDSINYGCVCVCIYIYILASV